MQNWTEMFLLTKDSKIVISVNLTFLYTVLINEEPHLPAVWFRSGNKVEMAFFTITWSTFLFWAALIILHSSNLTSTKEATLFPRGGGSLDVKLRRLFNLLDYDNNNKIEFQEFLNAIGGESEVTSVKPEELRAAVKLSEKRVEHIFKLFDVNQDHLLEKSEITAVFEAIDSDYDEAITFEEFVGSAMEFTYGGETADDYLRHEEF
ncbi:uncharacterized protein LOC112559311 isoform X2 [Pomacea canaliculata]|uniref:uncharacterized protein LOC112559311 isoform X2 n=1 Tax=Pomacea canaliculata TaxID=400727 RepID=UPI000D73DAAC|nr:uncharacterized protein LOC112559311 isoform X2 [Pomacea canaliculata]